MNVAYPMKTVAKMTGLSPHVIRIWERRYGAIRPSRTPTNRRVYSGEDLERLNLLGRLTHSGYSIGGIAAYSLQELQRLAGEGALPKQVQKSPAKKIIQQCLDKISHLDERGLEQTLNRAAVQLSQRFFLEQCIYPLINEVGCLWEQGTLRVAHEHFATTFLRSYLVNTRAAFSENSTGPRVVVGTPAGQLHEMGALLAAKTAQSEGWNVLYLGPNLPAEELAAAVERSGAVLLALSVVYPPDDPGLALEIQRLSRLLSPGIKVLYGGRAAPAYQNVIEAQGGCWVQDLGALREELRKIREASQ